MVWESTCKWYSEGLFAIMKFLQDSRIWSGVICQSGVRSNTVFCCGCNRYVHKKSNIIYIGLVDKASFSCGKKHGLAGPMIQGPCVSILVDIHISEVVDCFHYPGDIVDTCGGCCIESWHIIVHPFLTDETLLSSCYSLPISPPNLR